MRSATVVVMLGLVTVAHAQGNLTGLMEHPCLLLSAETLPAIRANCANMEANRFGFSTGSEWERMLATADSFLAAAPYSYKVTIPAKPDKPALTWEYTLSDQTPPPHDERPDYPPWTAMFQERADSISTRIKYLSFAYVVTGERKYADAAREIVMHLTRWEHWTDRSYTAGRTSACLDTGHATKCVGIFYDWCHDTLSDADRATIRQAIVDKGITAILTDLERYDAATNGYAVLTAGLACASIAIRPEEPRAGEWLQAALGATRRSFDLGGSDGGAYEGPAYGTYLMDSFANVLDAVTVARVEHDLFEHPFLATMDAYCISQLTPDGRVMPNFSDGAPVAGYPETMAILAHRGSTAAAWYLEQSRNLNVDTLYSFIRFDADKLDPQPPTFEVSRPFVDIGYASLRDGIEPHTPYLAFKSGPPEHDIGHNHFDHNSFQLSYLGEFLIADRGYRHRFIPIKTKFTRGTIGHSSLVLDITDEYLASETNPDPGHDQIHRTGGRIEQFFTTPVLDYIQGQAASAYNSNELTVVDDFTRRIVYLKPWVYVMLDRVRTPAPHTYHLCLQASANATSARVADERWKIAGPRARLDCWFAGSAPIATAAQAYPGAEEYGEYITVSTQPQTAAEFLTIMYPRTHQGDSLLSNPGFEGSYRAWIPRGGEDAPNHVIDSEVKRSGESSGRIDGSGYYYSQRFPVRPGERVRGSVWVKTEGAAKGGSLVLYWWRGASIGSAGQPTGAPTEWTQVEVEGVAPEGAEEVSMACTFHDTGRVWYDDADIWLENPPEMLQIRRPEPTSVVLADGARGMSFAVDEGRLGVALGGEPVDLGDYTLATDGTLVCIGDSQETKFLYMQEGTSCSYDGVPILRTERPMTVCVWRGEDGVVHVRAQEDIAPHAARIAPADLRVTVLSDTPITQALCDDTPVRITNNGDGTYTLGGQ